MRRCADRQGRDLTFGSAHPMITTSRKRRWVTEGRALTEYRASTGAAPPPIRPLQALGPEAAIPSRSLLVAINQALRAAHVRRHDLLRPPIMHGVDPPARQIGDPAHADGERHCGHRAAPCLGQGEPCERDPAADQGRARPHQRGSSLCRDRRISSAPLSRIETSWRYRHRLPANGPRPFFGGCSPAKPRCRSVRPSVGSSRSQTVLRRDLLYGAVAMQCLKHHLRLEMVRKLPSLPRPRDMPSSSGNTLAHCPVFFRIGSDHRDDEGAGFAFACPVSAPENQCAVQLRQI
jgi:hypothetical protein